MDVTLDVLTEQIVAIDVVQQPAIDITVVTGVPGSDGAGVVPGGTTGQVLVKKSDANFDTQWDDPDVAAGVATVNGQTGTVVLDQDDIADGTTAKQYTATEKTKLAGIASGAQVNTVSSVAGKTGAVTLAKADVGLSNVDNTADTAKPVSTAQQAALDAKADAAAVTTALAGKANTTHSHSESDVTGLTADLAAKAPLASPAFTGTPTGITKTHVGLGNVDNTSDANKPVSTAQQTALNGKANTTHTHAESDITGLTTDLAAKQPLDADLTAIAGLTPTANDTLQYKAGAWANRTPAQLKTDLALTKGDVGLGNVDNTADTAKPVSTAQQAALDLKAPLASPAFTGTPTGITKTHVGLGNVDNTADTAKPVSTAQQTALDARMVWADGTQNTRPTTSSKVIWVGGTTQPTGMLTGDLWVKA